jgi:uncharacterized membrane protein YkoI
MAGFLRPGMSLKRLVSTAAPFTTLFAAAAATLLGAAPAAAEDRQACLTKEQREAVATTGKVVPLAKAIRAVRGRSAGRNILKARLCRQPNGLVYVLTLLAHDGKVSNATVDAATGSILMR